MRILKIVFNLCRYMMHINRHRGKCTKVGRPPNTGQDPTHKRKAIQVMATRLACLGK